jgi:hypothetical protein
MEYEIQTKKTDRTLDRRAKGYSEEGKLLDARIRVGFNP